VLTAYDFPTAQIVTRRGSDIALVGDSLGNVVQGVGEHASGNHGRDDLPYGWSSRAAQSALVVGDMPFLSYQGDIAEAVRKRRTVPEGSRRRGGESLRAARPWLPPSGRSSRPAFR